MPTQKRKKLGSLLIGAVKTGQDQFLDFLMLVGVSPDLQCQDGKTLAHHAAEYAVQTGDAEPLRKLVRYGANVYIKDKDKRTVVDILKSNPKLENEVRAAWLHGSRHLGVKDSTRGKNGEALLSKVKTPKREKHKTTEDELLRTGVLGQLSALRGAAKKQQKPLARPEQDWGGAGTNSELPTLHKIT